MGSDADPKLDTLWIGIRKLGLKVSDDSPRVCGLEVGHAKAECKI